ncbi:unnamed protein product [Blepharisma stoltei]|uniref:Uncharacterized protein n=1 Tax=Blepharisma stoltei TaxID=1481888 RepID=A0AAU9IAZ7_9CILI|nr:unnamed protein product [Blepharisma stoltei]
MGFPDGQYYRVENSRRIYFGCIDKYSNKKFSYFEFDLEKKEFKELRVELNYFQINNCIQFDLNYHINLYAYLQCTKF